MLWEKTYKKQSNCNQWLFAETTSNWFLPIFIRVYYNVSIAMKNILVKNAYKPNFAKICFIYSKSETKHKRKSSGVPINKGKITGWVGLPLSMPDIHFGRISNLKNKHSLTFKLLTVLFRHVYPIKPPKNYWKNTKLPPPTFQKTIFWSIFSQY